MCILAHVFLWNFNTSYVTVQHQNKNQTKGLKSYFNTSYVTVQLHLMPSSSPSLPNFNTSYVTVQQYSNYFSSIDFSNFNTSYVTVQRKIYRSATGNVTEFQYILCYGSTPQDSEGTLIRYDFNTSYVTVQLMGLCLILPLKKISIHLMLRFNASRMYSLETRYCISIHLMLRFNVLWQ